VAAGLVLLVASLAAWRTHRLPFGPGCSDIVVGVSHAESATSPTNADAVLIAVIQGPGDLDFSDPYPELVITNEGDAIALAREDSQTSPRTYKKARIAPLTTAALAGCVQSADFHTLDDDYFPCDSGAREAIVSGPASGAPKRIWAQFHSVAEGTCASRLPARLLSLKEALDTIRQQTADTGTPADPPPLILAR